MYLQFYLSVAFLTSAQHCQSTNIIPQIVPRDNAQYGLALEAIFGMGIRLHTLLDTSSGNFVVSPLSTTAVIGQLMLGAEGEFREHLYELLSLPKKTNYGGYVLHYGKDKINQSFTLPYSEFHLQLSGLLKTLSKRKPNEMFTLNLNNALFYNQNLELKKQFQKFLGDFYNTDIRALDFYNDTTKIINSWAAEKTNGLIDRVIENQLSPATASIFLNSLYFLAEWETPFSSQLNTIDRFFVKENKTVNTTYMLGMIEQIPYLNTTQYRMVNLPYKNRELGLYILYPHQNRDDKYDIKKFVQQLDPQEILQNVNKMKEHDVILKIPKLSLSNRISILEPLQKYAEYKKAKIEPRTSSNNVIDVLQDKITAYTNFTPSVLPDLLLSDAAKGVDFKVSDIVQQMVFSINEKGTEAAAVTAGVTDYMGGVKTVVLNRPFSFFIRHEFTMATIFWGTVSDPSRN